MVPQIDADSSVAISISILVASLMAFILYRRTTPRLPRNYCLLLGCLRWVSVLIIMLLVTSPEITIVRSGNRKPVVSVLIDESRSMQYPDSSKIRLLTSHALDSALRELSSKVDLRLYSFSDDLRQISLEDISSIKPAGSRTDLAGALKSLIATSAIKPSVVVVISDGANNYGDDPSYYASHLSIPVYCIATIGTKPTPDIALESVEADEIAYAGSRIKVWLDISGTADTDIPTRVTISDSVGIVYSGQVVVPSHGAKIRMPIDLEVGDMGIHGFRVRIDPFEGENVLVNNESSFSVKVIKGKVKVCLIAAYPSWDFAFARRALKQNPSMEVSTYLTRTRLALDDALGRLSDALVSLDVLVIFKGAKLAQEYDAIQQYLNRGGALLFISGEADQRLFADFAPFVLNTQRQGRPRLYAPVVTSLGQNHDVMRVGMESQRFSWSRLPPLPVPGFIAGSRKQALVLLEGRSNGDRVDLLTVMRIGAGRIAAFSCFDLWKWDIAPKGFGLDVSAYDELLTNLISWLNEREETRPLVASTSRLVYMQGEPIDISARLSDDLKPVAGARLDVVVRRQATGETILASAMTDKGNGNYSMRIDQLPSGEYSAMVRARTASGKEIAQSVRFDVDRRGLEDSNFDGEPAVLEQLAAATGGRVLSDKEVGDLTSVISPGTIVVRSSKAITLKLNFATFALLAILFGIEWLIRKRKLLV